MKLGIRFIQVAVIYFLIGTLFGLVMGATNQFQYASAHAHINLVGWVSLSIIGLIYCVFPKAGETGLARLQFWLHNIGLPLLVISFILFAAGTSDAIAVPFTAVGGILVILSVILLVINVFKHVKAS